jgi:hypothetical protein
MNIGVRPKIVLALGLVVGLLAYLVIVDLGINAGRIHRGVQVAGLDVGGLTPTQAEEKLRQRADELKYALISFHRDGVVCRFTPLEVGWDPRPDDTATAADEVGREDGIWGALSHRFRSWFFGAKVHWRASIDARKMRRTITACELQALTRHLAVDRQELRRKIKHAIVHLPRRNYRVPIEG